MINLTFSWVGLIIWFAVMIIIHELGHIYWAKKEGIYQGIGFTPIGFYTKLKRPYKNKWGYAMGFIFSIITLPLFYIIVAPNITIGFLGLVGASIVDFGIICIPSKYYTDDKLNAKESK